VRYLIPLLLLTLLSGCTRTVDIFYIYVSEGVYAHEDKVWDQGVIRDRFPTDKQALQFVTDDHGIQLVRGELAYYRGTLYSLSNYRELLLANGYVTENLTRTSNLLDTTLRGPDSRVRLIYQRGANIRILFEKPECLAHILLEE
jgi:hypothetical protein